MESILTSIKKLLGIEEFYEIFDSDIIMYINSVFSTLTQLGVGPEEGFSIKDKTATWSEYLNNDPRLDLIKNYAKYIILFIITAVLVIIMIGYCIRLRNLKKKKNEKKKK